MKRILRHSLMEKNIRSLSPADLPKWMTKGSPLYRKETVLKDQERRKFTMDMKTVEVIDFPSA